MHYWIFSKLPISRFQTGFRHHSNSDKRHLTEIFICISLIICEIVLFFSCLWAIWMILSRGLPVVFFAHFSIKSFVFLLLIFKSSLHINKVSYFSTLCAVNNFSIYYLSLILIGMFFFLSNITESNSFAFMTYLYSIATGQMIPEKRDPKIEKRKILETDMNWRNINDFNT